MAYPPPPGTNADPDYAESLLRSYGYKEIPVSRSTIHYNAAAR